MRQLDLFLCSREMGLRLKSSSDNNFLEAKRIITIGKRYIKNYLYLSLFVLLLIQSNTIAQDCSDVFPDCWDYFCSGTQRCTANDVGISYVYLADTNGDPLSSCREGDLVEAYVWAGFWSTATTKYFAHAIFNVTINNSTSTIDLGQHYKCVGTLTSANIVLSKVYGPIPNLWCGDNVTLTRIATAWSVDSDDTCGSTTPTCNLLGHPKCRKGGTIVARPYPPGSISGYKWEDINSNGLWDDGEPALEGWNITLANETKQYNLTDENGRYIFIDLSNDNYVVSETLEDGGWEQTYPPGGTHSVTLAQGSETATDKNFGNHFNASYTLNKTAEYSSPATPGTKINYTIWINNTGKDNLTRESVEDYLNGSLYGALLGPYGDTSADGILNRTEDWRYEFNITINQSDFDVDECDGWINNTVITNFTTSRGEAIEQQEWANVTIVKCQTADAGEDQIVCGGVPVNLTGISNCSSSVGWSDDGCKGDLEYPTTSVFNATYTPPRSGEIFCNLFFNTTGHCDVASDNVTVYVVESPDADIRVVEPVRFSS